MRIFEELEEVLISSDLGVQTTTRMMQELQQSVAEQRLRQPIEIRDHLKQSLLDILLSTLRNCALKWRNHRQSSCWWE